MTTKPKKTSTFKRALPDLPDEFAVAQNRTGPFAPGEVIYIEEQRFSDLDSPNLSVGTLQMDSCTLERVRLRGGKFGAAVWKDVRLLECDLANVRAHRMSLVRVELIDCRLTGFAVTALEWQDVLVRNGDLTYGQFGGGKFKSCEFENCRWEDADFSNADLTGWFCVRVIWRAPIYAERG